MSVFEDMKANCAVRSYKPEQVSKEVVQELIDAAVLAPTAMHKEPWVFAVVQDRDLLKLLSDDSKLHVIETAHTLPESHREKLVGGAKNPDFNVFYDAGTLIVIYGRPLTSFVEADCWMAAENIMLAASSMGMGACVIGLALGALNNPKWKKRLSVPEDLTAHAAVIVGYPMAEKPPKSRKKPEIYWK